MNKKRKKKRKEEKKGKLMKKKDKGKNDTKQRGRKRRKTNGSQFYSIPNNICIVKVRLHCIGIHYMPIDKAAHCQWHHRRAIWIDLYAIHFFVTRLWILRLHYYFRVASCSTDLGKFYTAALLVMRIKIEKYEQCCYICTVVRIY